MKRPGKVIAVHLNFRSRAEQRGRVPAHPSYFLKPSSSVAAGGDTIERPAGTELLTFEGEIAVVIGRPTRRVTLEQARAAISGVTAANDFGLNDLRAADAGSNLRSKGGDGFTPLGPAVIDADGLDLADLRIRTWVNGELRQEDTTAGLLFPFEQIVADLSQMLTLDPGDVILTGTPAGASVVGPGDRVEVEVDAPGQDPPGRDRTGRPGHRTTGRLLTHVVGGTIPFGDVGARPFVDDRTRREAWGETVPATAVATDWATLTADVGTAELSAELGRRGLVDVFLEGVTPLSPGSKVAGPARTLRTIAFRPDLVAPDGVGHHAQQRAFDTLRSGEVLVIEGRGLRGAATVGDLLALRAKRLGAAGVVTDGCVRDSGAVAGLDLPVFSRGRHPSVLGKRHVPWETDVTVSCGGAAVQPGDLVVGDGDGVIVIPIAIAPDVVAAAVERRSRDTSANHPTRPAPHSGEDTDAHPQARPLA